MNNDISLKDYIAKHKITTMIDLVNKCVEDNMEHLITGFATYTSEMKAIDSRGIFPMYSSSTNKITTYYNTKKRDKCF